MFATTISMVCLLACIYSSLLSIIYAHQYPVIDLCLCRKTQHSYSLVASHEFQRGLNGSVKRLRSSYSSFCVSIRNMGVAFEAHASTNFLPGLMFDVVTRRDLAYLKPNCLRVSAHEF